MLEPLMIEVQPSGVVRRLYFNPTERVQVHVTTNIRLTQVSLTLEPYRLQGCLKTLVSGSVNPLPKLQHHKKLNQ